MLSADGPGDGGAPSQPDDLTAWAGPSRPTTLSELLQVTIRQSPSLAGARIEVAIADARIQQTWSRNDWRLGAQANASKGYQFVLGNRLTRTNFDASADVSRALPTGGLFTLRATTAYENQSDSADPEGRSDTDWLDTLSIAVSQPLLRAGGRSYFNATERRATLARDASVLAKRLAAIQAVQAVVSAYWDLVLAERQVAITRSSLDLARERLRITTIGSDGGKVPRSEIPAVQQIIATREEDVLNGELGVLDRSIALRRAAGMAIGRGEMGLRVDPDLAIGDTTFDLGALSDRAFAASPELAQLAKQDSSAQIDIEVTENGLLPQLDAAVSFGPIGQDNRPSGALEALTKLDNFAISGSLTFSQGLHRDDVRGRAREFRETRKRIAVTAFDVRAQIAQTMARSVAQVELAKRRVALSQRAIDLANENIKIESDRFNLGKATNFDVLNRQEELRQAELRKAQAMIDWHKAETVIEALTGDILPTYGVSVD